MIADLAEVRRALQPPPGTSSIQQVCDAVEALLAEKAVWQWPKIDGRRLIGVMDCTMMF